MIAFIALGSNIGERDKYIKLALENIESRVGKILKQSSTIETKPYGYTDQEQYEEPSINEEPLPEDGE